MYNEIEKKAIPQEGELYKLVNVYGKFFELRYGYYEEKDREAFGGTPVPIYPNLHKEPQYMEQGLPILTRMQRPCRFYDGKMETDADCDMCKHFERCEKFFGVCRCRINQIGHHLLDVLAERLGCTRQELKKPENRERILKELNEGEFDRLTAADIQDVAKYIAPPMKVLLYGTEADEQMLREWEDGENYFSEILCHDTFEKYVKALQNGSFDVIVCMADGDDGVEALKAAHDLCREIPLMWFPTTIEQVAASFKYGCSFANLQKQMNLVSLTFGIDCCREK